MTSNLVAWEGVIHFSATFPYFPYILQVTLWLVQASTFETTMTDPLSSPIPAPSNLLLVLNLNITLNPETKVHDDIMM